MKTKTKTKKTLETFVHDAKEYKYLGKHSLLNVYRKELENFCGATYPKKILDRRYNFLSKKQKDEHFKLYLKFEKKIEEATAFLEKADRIIAIEAEKRNDPWDV